MADIISRLKLESGEFDSKIKRAGQELMAYSEHCRKTGLEMGYANRDAKEFAKALGNMQTTSSTARGKISELSDAFVNLRVMYKNMTDEEKNNQFGKNLAASLDQLKTRIQEAKTQLDTATQSLNDNGEAGKGTSSIMEMLKDKFTVNIDAIKLFNIGLQAAEGALSIAKDAFFNNEEQLDEWGRVVESSHSLYTGFLNALNTGDISGYLSNINQIVQAARDAYDALDNLGTYNAFNQINVERTRTNMTESIADYRGGKGSKETVKAAGEAYKKELQDRKRLENDAYLAAVKRVAAERGVSAKDLTDALSGTYGHYQDLKNVQPTGVRQTVVGAGMFARTGTETFAQTRQEKLGEALRHLNDTELQSLQALGAQAQRTGTEIAQVDKQLTRVLNGRQPGAAGGTTTRTAGASSTKTPQTELQQNQAKINTLQQEYVRLGDEATESSRQRQAEIQKEIQLLQQRNGLLALRGEQAMGRLLPVDTSRVAEIAKDGITGNPFLADNQAMEFTGSLKLQLDEKAMEAVDKQIKKQTKGMKGGWEDAAGAIQAVGSAMSQIEDPAAKVVGTVAQAIATIALGYAQATTQAASAGPWAWIAFAATGLATMLTTISAIHSATGYAQGGMIKGNSYSGDNIGGMVDGGVGGFVGLNAGEIVLNRSQTGNLASQLQGSGFGNARLVGRLKGRDILISIDRELSATGKGQLATWK